MRQVGIGKTVRKGDQVRPGQPSLAKRRNNRTTSKPGTGWSPGKQAWREPAYWPGGVRRGDDVIPICRSCKEREKAGDDMTRLDREVRAGGGSVPRQEPKALSTDAAPAGGPARSSHEAPARRGGGGAKGSAHQDLSDRATGTRSREET